MLSACTLIAGDTAQAVRDAADVLDENRAVGNHFAAFFACVTGGVAWAAPIHDEPPDEWVEGAAPA